MEVQKAEGKIKDGYRLRRFYFETLPDAVLSTGKKKMIRFYRGKIFKGMSLVHEL